MIYELRSTAKRTSKFSEFSSSFVHFSSLSDKRKANNKISRLKKEVRPISHAKDETSRVKKGSLSNQPREG